MSNRLVSFIALFFICTGLYAQNLLWNVRDINKNCVYSADAICKKAPVAVTDKQVTRSGNKHNFEALSIYFWPNPNDPSGPYIEKDGQANPEIEMYDLPRLSTLKYNLRNLSQAYYIKQEPVYLEAYLRQIDTWFINKRTRMRPDFEYNQFIPGRNNGKGCAGGLIDAYNFVEVIESIYLVNSIHSIDKKRMKALRKWFKNFAGWMQTSEIGHGAYAAENNHGAAYDVTLFSFAYFIGDHDLCNEIKSNFAKLRINPQITDDGRQPLELKRTKAFHYSIYNLQHMVDFCIMQKNLGYDYINNEGKRIKTAIQFLKQYIGKKKNFPYQEIGDWNSEEKELLDIISKVGL